jgi:glycosyltransferase involved in cell wall biosynthesis
MIAFQNQGHKVISLSQAKGTFIHPYLSAKGIETTSYVLNPAQSFYYLKHIFFLIGFCRRKKIDIIYSHLESANFVASVSQFFIKAKVFICRHHIDEAALQGFDKALLYRLTYKLAKKIIVVSDRGLEYMVSKEKIKRSKIIKINLAYDFTLYARPEAKVVSDIRAQAPLILLTISRLTRYKRVDLSIRVLKRIIDSGISAKLIVLGKGEEEDRIKTLCRDLDIADNVIIKGFVSNVSDYLAAADFLLHPSVLESSCVAVKEAAIAGLPVIVCREVGDFDDYMVNGYNGFLVDKERFEDESFEVIRLYGKEKGKLRQMANNLRETVEDLFNISKIISQYDTLNS